MLFHEMFSFFSFWKREAYGPAEKYSFSLICFEIEQNNNNDDDVDGGGASLPT